MVATNHAITGALIGLSIGHPVALPLAFASHFVLDSVPHFGIEDGNYIKTNRFKIQLAADILLCGLLVLILLLVSPVNWILASVCAFLATSPDFMWLPRFMRAQKGQKEPKSHGIAVRFHSWIQWFQQPIGAVVELAWISVAVFSLVKMLNI